MCIRDRHGTGRFDGRRAADRRCCRQALGAASFAGDDPSCAYTVRNLVESDEQTVGAERIVTIVKDRRYDGDEDALFEI